MGESLPQPKLKVGGAIPRDAVYIERPWDAQLLNLLEGGEYCNVLCSRQTGKTSLMLRTKFRLAERGFLTADVDIAGRLGTPTDADSWYCGLLRALSSQLGLSVDVKDWWRRSPEITPNQKLLSFFREEVMARTEARIAIFLDEIDHTLNFDFTDDFFLAIRSMYNDQASQPEFKRLAFCLVGVATPNELIKRQRTTSYNVGKTLELGDFDSQRDDLTPLHRAVADDLAHGQALVQAVMRWTGGHPYLTSNLCERVAKIGCNSPDAVDQLVEQTICEEESITDDYRTHFEQVNRFITQRAEYKFDTIQLYRRILRGKPEPDKTTVPCLNLKLAGLVKRNRNGHLTVRNEIYRRRFNEAWTKTVVPRAARRLKRQRTVAAAAAAVLFAVVIWFGLALPQIYISQIQAATNQIPTVAHAGLRKIPGYASRADESLAQFWDRHAMRSELRKTRDEALIYRLKALEAAPNDSRRRDAGLLAGDCYERIKATFRDPAPIRTVAVRPDGLIGVTGSEDGMHLWNLRTGQAEGPTFGTFEIRSVIMATQELINNIVVKRTNEVMITNVVTLRHILSVAFSPNGRTLLTGSEDQTAQFWDAATGQTNGPTLRHRGRVVAVAFSMDGQTVLTGSDDKTAQLWDARTGQPNGPPLKHAGKVTAVAFSPDGETALTGSLDGTAQQWNVTNGQPKGSPLRHYSSVTAVAFSPDGKSILTGSYDGTAQMWSAGMCQTNGVPLWHESTVFAVAFSHEGPTAATGSSEGAVRLWNAKTGELIGMPLWHANRVLTVAFGADGQTVLTGGDDLTARLWDARADKPQGVPLKHEDEIVAVAMSADGQSVLTGSADMSARLWNARTGQASGSSLSHELGISAVAFSPDGRTALTGSYDKTARLWDLRTGQSNAPPLRHEGAVYAVTFSPDGKFALTGSADNTARLWNARTGESNGPPLRHDSRVVAVTFSPNGETIVTGSSDKTARLWDGRTGFSIAPPLRHESNVLAVAFSPDGKTVLTGSEDGRARLWDARTGEPKGGALLHHGPVIGVSFSPDGQNFLAATPDRRHLWPLSGSTIDFKTRWIHSKRSAPLRCVTRDGTQIQTVEWLTGNEIVVRELRFDQAEAKPVVGDPTTLLSHWTNRLGLKFQSDGVALEAR